MTFELAEHVLRVETARSGPITFQIGLDPKALEVPLLRVSDTHERFRRSPLSQVASRLEREVAVSSIFGTNSIEGGTLSEEETGLALELGPARVQGAEEQRALNLKAAYDLSREAASDPEWRLDIGFIRRAHAAITDKLPHERMELAHFGVGPRDYDLRLVLESKIPQVVDVLP